MRKRIKIILVVLWMILIFLLSNQDATSSGKLTLKFIDNLIVRPIKTVKPETTSSDVEKVNNKTSNPIRKSAHFFLYFILGILVISLLKEYNLDNKKLIIYSILICLLYAISDEIHQIYVPGRNGKVMDVLIDTLGSSSGIGCYYLLNKKRNKYSKRK